MIITVKNGINVDFFMYFEKYFVLSCFKKKCEEILLQREMQLFLCIIIVASFSLHLSSNLAFKIIDILNYLSAPSTCTNIIFIIRVSEKRVMKERAWKISRKIKIVGIVRGRSTFIPAAVGFKSQS